LYNGKIKNIKKRINAEYLSVLLKPWHLS